MDKFASRHMASTLLVQKLENLYLVSHAYFQALDFS